MATGIDNTSSLIWRLIAFSTCQFPVAQSGVPVNSLLRQNNLAIDFSFASVQNSFASPQEMLHGLKDPGNSSLNRIHKHLHQRLYVAFKQTKTKHRNRCH